MALFLMVEKCSMFLWFWTEAMEPCWSFLGKRLISLGSSRSMSAATLFFEDTCSYLPYIVLLNGLLSCYLIDIFRYLMKSLTILQAY